MTEDSRVILMFREGSADAPKEPARDYLPARTIPRQGGQSSLIRLCGPKRPLIVSSIAGQAAVE
jgi:hypothetical protein